MKKSLLFLFIFIVGISAYADSYLYIDDFPVYRNQLGTEIVVPVKAHFDARVSAFQVYFNCPEGLVLHTVETGADSFISYTDKDGSTCIAEPSFGYNNSTIIAISTYSVMGYWIPEGSTNYETYGTVKWEAGDYDEFVLFRFSVSENFIGGHITLTTECVSSADARGGTVNDNGDASVTFTKDCNVTITDEPIIEKTPAPVIGYTINDDDVTITANGEGIVTLFVNGDEVNNPYVINRIFEDQTLNVFSYAQEVGKQISDTVTMTIVVPAKPMERCLTPILSISETNIGVVTITITNIEEGATIDYWVYRNDKLIKENSFTGDSHRFEVSGIGEYMISAIAKKEGMLDSYAGFVNFMIFEDPLPVLLGDVNYDGIINITDLNAMLNIIYYDGDFVVEADMNKDLIINVQDVVGLVHYLLNGEIPSISSNGRRAPKAKTTGQASLYWQDGVLYLSSDVPVSALNIINDVEGDITWNLDKYGMVVMQSTGTQGEHSVIFSFDRSTIPSGINAIATTSRQHPSVVAAELSNLDSELIPVNLNDLLTGLTSIQSDNEFNCHMDGTSLIINSGAALRDIDVSFITIDGRVMANQHLLFLNSGSTSIDMSDIIKGNRYFIIVVRNGRQILATKKLTQNK